MEIETAILLSFICVSSLAVFGVTGLLVIFYLTRKTPYFPPPPKK